MLDQLTQWMAQHGIRAELVLGTLALLVAAAIGILLASRLVQRVLLGIDPRFRPSYEVILLLTRTLSSVLWMCVAFLVLDLWGIGVSGLWTFLVSFVTLIGVGFLALWTLVSNITASVFLTIWRPFRLGESVEILPESLKGRVIDRNFMFTVLREEHGTTLHVPNNFFFQKVFRVSEEQQYVFESLEQRRRQPEQERTAAAQPHSLGPE